MTCSSVEKQGPLQQRLYTVQLQEVTFPQGSAARYLIALDTVPLPHYLKSLYPWLASQLGYTLSLGEDFLRYPQAKVATFMDN